MKVLLQDIVNRLYYAGPLRWVAERFKARDLRDVHCARAAFEAEQITDARIIIEGQEPVEPSGQNH